MIETKVLGISGEGRILCLNCAEILYGSSLEMYLKAGDIQQISDEDCPTYACKGLLCDDCLRWVIQPEQTQDLWWLVDPEPMEHIRLLAPFADFVETLNINVMNLRMITTRS